MVALLCQCQTTEQAAAGGADAPKKGYKRTVKSTRTTGYSIRTKDDAEAEKLNSGKLGALSSYKTEKEIRDSKGKLVRTERKTIYDDKDGNTANETGRSFRGTKDAKLGKNKFGEKQFKTPEYIKRQEFSGNKDYATSLARESGDESSLAEKLFSTKSKKSGMKSARESGQSASQANKSFATKSDSLSARKRTVEPTGVAGQAGYAENAYMSMDDVKKLVNPSSYRPNQ